MKAKNRGFVSKAMCEVWEWKDAVYRETEGMTMSEALNHIHREAEAIRKVFGLNVVEPAVGVAGVAVAEAGVIYGSRTTMRVAKSRS